MSKKQKILIAIATVVVLLIGLIVGIFSGMKLSASGKGNLLGEARELSPKVSREFTADENAPEGMVLVKKDGDLKLFMSEEDCSLAIFNSKTGKTWYTTPTDYQEDTIALGDVKNRIRSQLFLKYYNDKSAVKNMDSYSFCIKNGTFEVEPIEAGVRVVYTIGKSDITKGMLPAVVSKERFESLVINKIKDNEKALATVKKRYECVKISDLSPNYQTIYLKNYPTVDINKDLYLLASNCPIYEYQALYDAIFNTAGYTVEDLLKDNQENGITAEIEELERFVIPVEYTIEKGQFSARVITSKIDAPDTFVITDISLLEFFGAGGVKEDGYMFVPDGSGAIINFNNGKTDAQLYTLPVYSDDATKIVKEGTDESSSTALVPVFGISKSDCGMFAVIESGDAHATINAEISGKTHSYNQAYAQFNIRPYSIMAVSTTKGMMYNNKYQSDYYQDDLTVRYFFLNGKDNGYVGMAKLYKNYLEENGKLVKSEDTKFEMVTELVGQINTTKFVLGIPISVNEAVTSFDDAEEIANELYDLGVKNATIKYSSWQSGSGIYPGAASKAKIAGNMGGKGGFGDLKTELTSLNMNVYLNAPINNVYDSMPNFNKNSYATRLQYNQISNQRFYNIATLQSEGSKYYNLSARYLKSYIEKYIKRANKFNADSLWFEDLGARLNSDYHKKSNIDRAAVKDLTVETLEYLHENVGKLGFDSPNVYAWKYADKIVNLPLTTSGQRMANESVPFIQIVLSGYMSYTGQVINTSGQDRVDMLKSVETGAGLYFKWIHASNEAIKDMEGNEVKKLYSLYYKDWIETAASYYNEINDEAGKLIGTEIINHEKLEFNVYKTTYEHGYVIVNYNDSEITVNGTVVPAKDFVAVVNK